MENQTIFITGITGQDGIFLTSQLINEKNNLKIYGSTRLNDQKGFFSKLDIINKEINEKSIDLLNLNLEEGTEVRNVFQKIKPDYVIHGDDWNAGVMTDIKKNVVETLSEIGGELIEVPYTKGISTTDIINKIIAVVLEISNSPNGIEEKKVIILFIINKI